MFTTCGQKTLDFFQWLWLLAIINFIIPQLFAKHWFLKNISEWMLLTSKFFSEFYSMFCYHKFRMLQKGFSHLFFAWSVKWWVSLKLWNNHARDWINNFPVQSILWRAKGHANTKLKNNTKLKKNNTKLKKKITKLKKK